MLKRILSFFGFGHQPKYPPGPRQGDVIVSERLEQAARSDELAKLILEDKNPRSVIEGENPNPAFTNEDCLKVVSLLHSLGHWKIMLALNLVANDCDLENAEVRHAATNVRVSRYRLEEFINHFVTNEIIDTYEGSVLHSMVKSIVDLQMRALKDEIETQSVQILKEHKQSLLGYMREVRRLDSE